MVTDTHVYFYKFDEDSKSLIPKLVTTMNNFMGCISLLVDSNDKICVSYKSGQNNFTTYKRKYDHGFREIIDSTSREGTCGLSFPSKGMFMISDDDYVQIHGEKNYKLINRINVPLQQSDTDDEIEIISIAKSQDDKHLGILSGKNLIKGIESIYSLHIYIIHEDKSHTLKASCHLPESFRSVSKSFVFDKVNPDNSVIFVDNIGIKRYNYMVQSMNEMYKFKNPIQSQPDYIVFSEFQHELILASSDDVLWVNIVKKNEVDIDN